MGFIAVYITNKTKTAAHKLADELLELRLIACANIYPIESSYHWQGKIVQDREYVALVKTTSKKWEQLKAIVTDIHPYQTPCIMKYDVEANDAYEKWIFESVS